MKVKIPNQKKTGVKTYKQTVINTVILVVVLALCLYVAIQLSRNFSTQVSTQRTQIFTDISYAYIDGYIFTNAEAVSMKADIVHYKVRDGEKVGMGQEYAEIYSETGMSASEKSETEKKLNDLSERIRMLERGLEGGKTVSDLGNISADIEGNYYTYIDSVLSGDFISADRSGERLFAALVDYSSVTLAEAAKNTLAELIAERDAILSQIGGSKQVLVSDRSFIFSRSADGYENTFNSSQLDAMTPEDLNSVISQKPGRSDSTIGCMIYSSKWYLALPTEEAMFETFRGSVGTTYDVGFLSANNTSLPMLLEAAVADEEDPSKCYLLFSSFDMAKILGFGRQQSVRITLDEITGYRIPEGAIHTVSEQNGVYIVVGNMIEFRRVTIIGRGDGYYIVNTYEKDLAEGTSSEIPYLGINDLIVTSGNDLYDGKLLD